MCVRAMGVVVGDLFCGVVLHVLEFSMHCIALWLFHCKYTRDSVVNPVTLCSMLKHVYVFFCSSRGSRWKRT